MKQHQGLLTAAVVLGSLFATACASDDDPPNLADVEQGVWANGDFENDAIGTTPPTGWTRTSNRHNGITDTRPGVQTLASLNLAAGGTLMTSVVGGVAPESQVDPNVGSAGTLRYPKYGLRAAVVNYGGPSATGANNNVNTLKQTMTVSLGDVDPVDDKVHVRFAVAPVLENPGHSYTEQPYYFVRLQNLTTGTTIYQDFNASGQPGVPWKNFSGTAGQYTDWQLVDVSPGNALLSVGDQVELTITAAGCSQGGHWGRVYVDGVGSGVPGLYGWATGPQQANAGSDITYTVNYKNGGTTTTSGTKLDFVTPPNTTYQAVSLGGACTTPTVGSTGTLSCALGTLAPGATGQFTVRVNIPSGTANGTLITNGNYAVYATGVSALVGPKVFTNVTSSVSYADVGVSMSDGVAALGWGQAISYNIVVSNNGPVAAPTVQFVNAKPAQLASTAWTCIGAGGGTCPASGTGSISTNLSLPVGASVTFTVDGTIVAGSGSSSVVNTATATVGGGVTDPDTTNNTAVDTNAIGTLRTLTVAKTGNTDGGTISTTPSSISCGVGCTGDNAEFLDGSPVILTVSPVAGGSFTGWGGACSGTATTCSVTMSSDLSVTANFVGGPAAIAANSGSPQTTTVNTAFASPLSVLVTDSLGQPVQGAVVTFSAPAGTVSSTLGATSATTSALGLASTTVVAKSGAGTYNVTATTVGVAGSVSFALTNLGVPATVTVSSGSGQSETVGNAFTDTLSALVRDAANQPLANITVTFAAPATGASATLGATTASTNASGIATISATAGTVSGSYSVTASAAGVATPASFSLTNVAGASMLLTIVSGDGQTPVVGTALAAPYIVRVADVYGNGIAGASVEFEAPMSGASATLDAATSTTNSLGNASLGATAGTVAGTYNVIASIGSLTVSLATTNVPGATAAISIVSGNDQNATVGTAFASSLEVLAVDMYGNPVPGVVVGFSAPGTGPSATVPPAAITGVTGVAAISATANGLVGDYVVTATVGGITTTFTLTNSPGAPATITVTSGDEQAAVVDQAFASPLEFRVVDSFGNPVPGATVVLVAPATGATAQLASMSVTTNAAGTASVAASAGTVTGSYLVTASITGIAPVSVSLTNQPGAAATVTITEGTDQDAVVDTAFTSALSVVVRDAFGNALPLAVVTFTASTSTAEPSAELTFGSSSTNAAGAASINATANQYAGSYTVVASVDGATSATFELNNLPDVPAAATASAVSNPQSTTVNTAFEEALTITVVDRFGNPTPAIDVSFAAPASGATATLSAATVTTNAVGEASLVATANSQAGSYVVIADLGLIPVAFALTNLPGAPATLVVNGGDTQSTIVDTSFAAPLAVLVIDADSNPVPGTTVTFTAPDAAASAILAQATVVTDAAGAATVAARATTTTGAYLVTAIVDGAEAPVAFALRNTAAAPASITASLAATPQATGVLTPFLQPLVSTVRDIFGNPVPGIDVTYVAPSVDATASLSATLLTTDLAGQVAPSALASDLTGTFTVTATVSGVATPATFALTNLAGGAATITIVSGSEQSAIVTTAFAERLDVLVTDAYGNAVPGAEVTYVAPSDGATAVLSTGGVTLTDSDGLATLIATAGTATGTYEVVVSIVDGAAPVRFTLGNLAGAVTASAVWSGSTPQTAKVETAFAQPLRLTVRDTHGNPVPGVDVTFAAPASAVTASLSVTETSTDVDGTVEVLAIASAEAGSYVVLATVDGIATPIEYALTNSPALPAAIAVLGGSDQHTMATTAFAQPMRVRVTDHLGNPVAGVNASVLLPTSGATAEVSTLTPVTDANGEISVSLVAMATPGSFEASLVVDGAASPATMTLTVDAIPTVIAATAPAEATDDGNVTIQLVVGAELGTATGNVDILDPAGAVLGSAVLVNGAASITLALDGFGSYEFVARYAAQGSYGASRSSTVAVDLNRDSGSLSGGGGCSTSGGSSGGLGILLMLAAVVGLRRRRRAPVAIAASVVAAVAGVVVSTPSVRAEPQSARAINRFHAASPDSEWLGLDSVTFAAPTKVSLAVVADYAYRPLVAYNADGSERGSVVSDALVTHLSASIAVHERVRLAATAPVAVYQNGESTSFDGMELVVPKYAFGDVSVAGAVRLTSAQSQQVRVALELRTTFPTGSATHFMSDGVMAAEPRLLVGGTLGPVEYAASAGAYLREATEMESLRFGNEFRYGAALGVRALDGRLLIGPEFTGAFALSSSSDIGSPMEISLSAHVNVTSEVRVGAGAGLGLKNAIGTPDQRVQLSVEWRP